MFDDLLEFSTCSEYFFACPDPNAWDNWLAFFDEYIECEEDPNA